MTKVVDYERPPVVEVVCGVNFRTEVPFRIAYIGLFWEQVKESFPDLAEADPIVRPNVEGSIDRPEALMIPRSWFVSADGLSLIQLQRDRFLFNWKREDESTIYPSYTEVMRLFEEQYGKFLSFLGTLKLGDFELLEYELTYINHISEENGLGEVDRDQVLTDHRHEFEADRFLTPPNAYQWQSRYPLPDDFGHLYVTTQTAARSTDNKPLIRLDLSARGLPPEEPQDRQ